MTAVEMAEHLKKGTLSAVDVMESHLKQIDAVNPTVNAIITLLPEMALQKAREADQKVADGVPLEPLHGVPIAHKDLVMTKGIRTTYGSTVLKNFVPDTDAIIVERLREAGAICLGKTNVPEFGAGSQTHNPVFGSTLNPYDLTKTCGGSSGGAAVALACGMLPIADGSDMGGSLRNPANFCNIVGFRPSPGRVALNSLMAWQTLSVNGPMARTVKDLALLLSAIAGPDSRDPISLSEPGEIFRKPLDRDFKETRIGWSRDLGGLPVDPRVTQVIEKQIKIFEKIGCQVDEIEPDFSEADDIFKVLRHWYFAASMSALVGDQIGQVKKTIQWEVELGKKLTGTDISQAEIKHTQLFNRMHTLMEKYEYLIFPVNQVPPFDVNQEFVTEINGEKMDTYIDWMKSCYFISATGHPAISVPCGFTEEGLPVGVQIVGRHQADFSVLQLAYAFEQSTEFWKQRPELVL